MLANWPIRNKLLLKLALLLVLLATLSTAGMIGLYSYRNLAKSISHRTVELPYAAELSQDVMALRVRLTEILQAHNLVQESGKLLIVAPLIQQSLVQQQFELHLKDFEHTLDLYKQKLVGNEINSTSLGRSHDERQTARKIEETLGQIRAVSRDKTWSLDETSVSRIDTDLKILQHLTAELPSYLHGRMQNFADEVKIRYRTLIYITWACTLLAVVTVLVLLRLFFSWIFQPLRLLIQGSRQIAAGDFDHRINLQGEDEVSELAQNMNDMTERFQAIRNDLEQQVRQRTVQMVRSEQLASVGFLAAGVAHEINNPMASIAMCAESLERRLDEGVVSDQDESNVARRYLRMIQDEAFRCKKITAQLLDFSRTGDGEHENTDLRSLIQGVIEMVSHVSKNQQKRVELTPCKSVIAIANPQEIKQVVLNLITNALDSVDAGGEVTIQLDIRDGMAQVVVEDDGCGMTAEVLQNLFEPFFTRRRNGQGTGLGMSIAYRIIEDHDGRIDAESDGPGRG
ncbi:MAG: ATP-binding protein, partial [Planctomycetales bacterium]